MTNLVIPPWDPKWTKAIVCGGRFFGRSRRDDPPEEVERAQFEQDFVARVLNAYRLAGLRLLAEGGAPGVDFWAARWARRNAVWSRTYPADWGRYGPKRAGPIRNREMRDDFGPDAVIAFPGNTGTADMVVAAFEVRPAIPVLKVAP